MLKMLDGTEKHVIKMYLWNEFGDYSKVRMCHCPVVTPEVGVKFLVTQPIQTCHPDSRPGLDKNQCLPMGRYRVTWLDAGSSSHYMELQNLDTGAKVSLIAGYSELGIPIHQGRSVMMDWRGAVKLPRTQKAKKISKKRKLQKK